MNDRYLRKNIEGKEDIYWNNWGHLTKVFKKRRYL